MTDHQLYLLMLAIFTHGYGASTPGGPAFLNMVGIVVSFGWVLMT
jgi:hypothetical protein